MGLIMSKYEACVAKARGFNHIRNELPCQDSAHRHVVSSQNYAIIAVADGHGGTKYFRSQDGADLAARCANLGLNNFLKEKDYRQKLLKAKPEEREEMLSHLAKYILAKWLIYIKEDFEKNPVPVTDQEKLICQEYKLIGANGEVEFQPFYYGSTLLYACMTDDFCFASQIGDGKCLFLYDNGESRYPIKDDERLGFGMTTSLCDQEAINNFRHYFTENSKTPVQAIILATDGVIDSYTEESFSNKFGRKLLNFLQHSKKKAQDAMEDLRKEWLPTLSKRGSGDDASLAVVFRAEKWQKNKDKT